MCCPLSSFHDSLAHSSMVWAITVVALSSALQLHPSSPAGSPWHEEQPSYDKAPHPDIWWRQDTKSNPFEGRQQAV